MAVEPQANFPAGYTELLKITTLPADSVVNVIGVISDYSDIKTARNGLQKFITINLQDFSLLDSGVGADGISLRPFVSLEDALPEPTGVGDILLARGAVVANYSKPALTCKKRVTKWLLIPSHSIPKPEFFDAYVTSNARLKGIGDEEINREMMVRDQRWAVWLHANRDKLLGRAPSWQQRYASQRQMPPPSAPTGPRADRTASGGYQNTPTRPSGSAPEPGRNGDWRADPNYDPRHDRRKIENSVQKKKKFKLIQDAEVGDFSDFIVEVLEIWPSNYGSGCDIRVTDYTENTLAHYRPAPEEGRNTDYSDPHGYISGKTNSKPWAGPYGRRVVQVEVRHPAAQMFKDRVKESDIVLLQNVRTKLGQHNQLEANLFPDFKYPDKICVQKISDNTSGPVQDLLQRRHQYWQERKQVEGEKPVNGDGEAEGKKKKNSRKKKKQKQREADQAELAFDEQAMAANKHVRCSNADLALSTVQSILDIDGRRHMNSLPNGLSYGLPFINANYRACVQVMDFWPSDIRDFAVAVQQELQLDYDPNATGGWNWSCSMLLRDAGKAGDSDGIMVNMGHLEMQYLLGNDMPDPDDLRANRSLLGKLREKMCIIWGDLEEQKSAGKESNPSNMPFECCIAEYGVLKKGGQKENVEDWLRQYMMRGISIA